MTEFLVTIYAKNHDPQRKLRSFMPGNDIVLYLRSTRPLQGWRTGGTVFA
ncbi:hypothetical protein [Chitinophaga sp. XS-30]|nr:hypothetical protein [Chitinophaga sp. XS-30]